MRSLRNTSCCWDRVSFPGNLGAVSPWGLNAWGASGQLSQMLPPIGTSWGSAQDAGFHQSRHLQDEGPRLPGGCKGRPPPHFSGPSAA